MLHLRMGPFVVEEGLSANVQSCGCSRVKSGCITGPITVNDPVWCPKAIQRSKIADARDARPFAWAPFIVGEGGAYR